MSSTAVIQKYWVGFKDVSEFHRGAGRGRGGGESMGMRVGGGGEQGVGGLYL